MKVEDYTQQLQRELWERVYVATIGCDGKRHSDAEYAADRALESWNSRFNK